MPLLHYCSLAVERTCYFLLPLAMLILWGGERIDDHWSLKLLSWRPLAFIGAISYSLYLVHWPVVVFAKALIPHAEGTTFIAAATAISFALAWASYALVEQPTRRMRTIFSAKMLTTSSIAVASILILTAQFVIQVDGFKDRLDARTQQALAYQRYDYVPVFREGSCFLRPEQMFSDL